MVNYQKTWKTKIKNSRGSTLCIRPAMLKQAGKPLNVNAISYAHCRTKKFVN